MTQIHAPADPKEPLLKLARELLTLIMAFVVVGAIWGVMWVVCQASVWMDKKFPLPPSSIITVEQGLLLLAFLCTAAFFLFFFAIVGRHLGLRMPKLSIGSFSNKEGEK